jgi:lysophospholipase L1-like esterase
MTPGEKKLVTALVSTSTVLLAACVFLLFTRRPVLDTRAALADPALRDELMSRLGEEAVGIWDSHNDPEVGRVMLPSMKERIATGAPTRTNPLGLREKNFALPKPEGLLRIVLLGDSFIQGYGVEAEERVGVLLERYLREHASGWNGQLECLHIAVGGWDTVAECAYLRRMLTDLAPDLVLQFLITNDLDDHAAARGFGALAAFSPLEWKHTDALVHLAYPSLFSSKGNTNYILLGADWESLHRYQRVAEAVGRMVPPIRQSGARYVLVSHLASFSGKAWRYLKDVLAEKEFAVLPTRLHSQEDLIFSPSDTHWTRKGHELVARLLFTLIRMLDLLPELHLEPWPEAEEACTPEIQKAWKDAMRLPKWYWKPPQEGLSSLEPATFTDLEWRHVYTGLDKEAQVSPFASFYLAREGQPTLMLRGRALERPELARARVQVSVEGIPVGEHELAPGQPFEVRFALPAEIKRSGGIAVRLETSDYVYTGPNMQHCISFVLEKLALE